MWFSCHCWKCSVHKSEALARWALFTNQTLMLLWRAHTCGWCTLGSIWLWKVHYLIKTKGILTTMSLSLSIYNKYMWMKTYCINHIYSLLNARYCWSTEEILGRVYLITMTVLENQMGWGHTHLWNLKCMTFCQKKKHTCKNGERHSLEPCK